MEQQRSVLRCIIVILTYVKVLEGEMKCRVKLAIRIALTKFSMDVIVCVVPMYISFNVGPHNTQIEILGFNHK